MTLKAQNLIVLCVTGLCVVIILTPMLLPSERGGKMSPTMVIPPLLPKERKGGEERQMSSPATPPLSMEEGLGKDPFILPIWAKKASEGEGGEGTVPTEKKQELKLTATIRRGNKKMAAINHWIVREGDVIDGEKVIKIEADRVTLEGGGSIQVLTLKESQLPLKVTVPQRGEKR